MKTEKLGVVLLATENESDMYINGSGKLIQTTADTTNYPKRHLYFTSNAVIKEGDYFMSLFKSYVLKYSKKIYGELSEDYVKVEATTDKSILIELSKEWKTPYSTGFPKIPTEYIQEYIKSYNEGKVLTDVVVDLESIPYISDNSQHKTVKNGIMVTVTESIIKTTSDNFVVISNEEDKALSFAQEIKMVTHYDVGRFYGRLEGYKEATANEKRMYSREEVDEIVVKAYESSNTAYPQNSLSLRKEARDWIKNNLKI